MALDGVALSNIVFELKKLLLGGRIDKIYQPEQDEIVLSVRSLGNNYKVLFTANASHPRVHITQIIKDNPTFPPMFCMVLRKHISGGKIVEIEQPNFERIMNVKIESLNEMGDNTVKTLVIEIMGKHSNIMLLDENGTVLDSIKHISHDTSSVREILPGKKYILPPSQDKLNILELDREIFMKVINVKSGVKIQNMIYQTYTGISPVLASEICYRAGVDSSLYSEQLTEQDKESIYENMQILKEEIIAGKFMPQIIKDEEKNTIIEFSSVDMTMYNNFYKQFFNSISQLLEEFYHAKDNASRMKQKSHDLHRLVLSNIERCVKKKEIQNKTLKDIEDREKWKKWGELITSNVYAVQKGMTSFETQDFYEENMPVIKIKLDPELTAVENAQKYFKKYNKAKRTFQALQEQIKQNDDELEYLNTILTAIENSSDENNIIEIHAELAEQGYVKKRKLKKGEKIKKTAPLHYISSEGFDIYVGKNNKQNDELTLKFASSNDMWLHTKDIPGSHVIIKTKGFGIPEDTIIEAALLAAFYSKGRNSSSVPVEYTLKKNVKKPNGAKPGMVIYEENKTLYVTPEEKLVKEIKQI